MNRVRRGWARPWLLVAVHGAACGAESTGATPSFCTDPSRCSPPWTEMNCHDVEFATARGEATGIVACERTVQPPDVYSTRVEPCDGRGLGKTDYRGPIPCGSDAECPLGSTCGENSRVCTLPTVCEADVDCDAGEACICAGNVGYSGVVGYNQCISAECRSDADCGGYSCAVSNIDPCGKLAGMFCHTAADECARHSDCPRAACAFDPGVRAWRCDASGNFGCEEGLFERL
jgi:hypothetical protein